MTGPRRRDRTTPCPACGGRTRDGHLCNTCTDHTLRRLQDLPALWVDLQQQITRQTRIRNVGTPTPTSRPARPDPDPKQPIQLNLAPARWTLPFDPHAAMVARNVQLGGVLRQGGVEVVVKGLHAWVRYTITQFKAAPPKRGVTDLCEHLASYLPQLRKLGVESAEFVCDVWDWVDAVTQAIDLPMRDSHVKLGPCVQQHPVTKEWCPGTLYGVLPQERDSTRPDMTPPPSARCDTCSVEWPSDGFNRLTRRIAERVADDARRRKLAGEVAGRGRVA